MNRKLWMALLGASFLIPIEADAQRVRPNQRSADRYVAPASGRLAHCRAPARGRAYVCENDRYDNVVYRYSGRTGRSARRAWVTPTWRRDEIYLRRRDSRRAEIGQRQLREILGPVTVSRVREHGRRAGLNGSIRGHWLQGHRNGSTLILTMRRQEVARLIDYDRDGLVDDFQLRKLRRASRAW